jgi:predicted xylose isomerase-like sugar epimerase
MTEILKQMLNILIDIASTLKHIEQQLSEEKQHKVIKDAVHHALVGEKFTPKDF